MKMFKRIIPVMFKDKHSVSVRSKVPDEGIVTSESEGSQVTGRNENYYEVHSVDELISIIKKGDSTFQVMGKNYRLQLDRQLYSRNQTDLSYDCESDMPFIRSAVDITNSFNYQQAGPDISGDNSAEEQDFVPAMPKINIKVNETPAAQQQQDSFLRINTQKSLQLKNNTDLAGILQDLDQKMSKTQVNSSNGKKVQVLTSSQQSIVTQSSLSSSKKNNFKLDHSPLLKKLKSTLPDVGIMKAELQEENERLKQENTTVAFADQVQALQDENQLHLGFLFSSPLILISQQGPKESHHQIPLLDYMQECTLIKAAAIESKKKIKFLRKVATQANFIEMLTRKPKALHISCHGIKNTQDSIGMMFDEYKNDGDFLLFETEFAEGELVSSKQLRKLIRQFGVKLDLVFVAACKSEFVGRIFQLAGAKHVICVREGAEVLDKAALIFTRNFYKQIFKGAQICEAFDMAKATVEFEINIGSANMFKMLLFEEVKVIQSLGVEKQDPHTCCQFGPLSKGKLNNLTEKMIIKYFPTAMNELKSRRKEMFELIQNVCSGQRLTQLLGLPGIGKSSLVRSVLQYLSERRNFLGGIIFIQCKGIKSTERVIKEIVTKVFQKAEKEKIKKITSTNLENQIHEIIHQINIVSRHHDLGEQIKQFLLIIDNAEEIIEHSEQDFRSLTAKLLNECETLSIVVTSRRSMGPLQDTFQGKIQLLFSLKHQASVELFMERTTSDAISPEEIYELLTIDSQYPFAKLKLKNQISDWSTITTAAKSELMRLLQSKEYQISVLTEHDLFKQLAGNPHAITMIACARANPVSTISLRKVYDMVLSDRVQSVLRKEGPNIPGNEISLRISTESIINFLQDIDSQAYTFFYFLSLMPSGATSNQLLQLWGPSHVKCSEILQSFSFLEVSEQRRKITSYLMTYAEQSIEKTSLQNFNNRLIVFYEEMMSNFYNLNVQQQSTADVNQILEDIHNNIRVCITRIFKKDQEPVLQGAKLSHNQSIIPFNVDCNPVQIQSFISNFENKNTFSLGADTLTNLFNRQSDAQFFKNQQEAYGRKTSIRLTGKLKLGIGEQEIEDELSEDEIEDSLILSDSDQMQSKDKKFSKDENQSQSDEDEFERFVDNSMLRQRTTTEVQSKVQSDDIHNLLSPNMKASQIFAKNQSFKSNGRQYQRRLAATLHEICIQGKMSFQKSRQIQIQEIFTTPSQTTSSQQIGTTGRLLIYLVACLYLLQDYQTGFNYVQNDFSQVENSPLFKANMMRLQALFLESLYRNTKARVQNLVLAIEATKTALSLFSNEQSKSSHGIALSYFQLAHLQTLLADKKVLAKPEKENITKDYFAALQEFKKLEHNLGIYLCKAQLFQMGSITQSSFKRSESSYYSNTNIIKRHMDPVTNLLLELDIDNRNGKITLKMLLPSGTKKISNQMENHPFVRSQSNQ